MATHLEGSGYAGSVMAAAAACAAASRGAQGPSTWVARGELIGYRERNGLADTTLRGGHPRLGE